MNDDKELLRRAAKAAGGLDWQWWTSNSYRRLTFKNGQNTRDGGALSGTVHPHDKWPDVSMAPGVQEFIERASPKAVLALLDRIAELEAALRPFAEYGRIMLPIDAHDDSVWTLVPDDSEVGSTDVSFRDFRRAAAALGGEPGQPEGSPPATSGSSCLVHGECVAGDGVEVPGSTET